MPTRIFNKLKGILKVVGIGIIHSVIAAIVAEYILLNYFVNLIGEKFIYYGIPLLAFVTQGGYNWYLFRRNISGRSVILQNIIVVVSYLLSFLPITVILSLVLANYRYSDSEDYGAGILYLLIITQYLIGLVSGGIIALITKWIYNLVNQKK